MPSRAQNGGSMKESFDQHSPHSPTPSPSGARQAGHSGGSAASSAWRMRARSGVAQRVARDDSTEVVSSTCIMSVWPP
jgi:hypothetical protein